MKVFKYPNNLNIKNSSLILGSFEIIHNGHLKLIQEANKYKDPVVIMMIENPSILPKSKTNNATSLDVRLEQAANLGIHYAVVIKNDKKFIMTKGEDFIKKMIEITSPKRIIIGKDCKVGFNRLYNSQKIKDDFLNTIILDFLKINNTKMSTSIIKELLENGDVSEIKKLCPFPFQLKLLFDENKKSINENEFLKIKPGIYACFSEINDIIYWTLIHINLSYKFFIYVPDLRIKKQKFEVKLWFHKKIRTIISKDKDIINDTDKEVVSSYLNTL